MTCERREPLVRSQPARDVCQPSRRNQARPTGRGTLTAVRGAPGYFFPRGLAVPDDPADDDDPPLRE
jgi:hypothetical protein